MEALQRAYQGFRSFVDGFTNSTAGSDSTLVRSENREAWYAEWEDDYVYDILSTGVIRNLLRRVANQYYGEQVESIMDQAVELTNESFPQSYEAFRSCCEILGLSHPPQVYVTGKIKGINALSVEVQLKQYILISPQVTARLTLEEQAFLFGHELGHHQQGNLACHTVNGLLNELNGMSDFFGRVIPDTIMVPLKRWCRYSEFNADRAGYLCCKNPDCINRLFMKAMPYKGYSSIDQYNELSYAHPMMATRLSVLADYIKLLANN